MMSIPAPKFATWLLTQLGCGHANEAITGDLLERFRRHPRTRVWYWRQVLLAIVGSAFQEIRTQKLRTFGAMILAFAGLAFTELLLAKAVGPITSWLPPTLWNAPTFEMLFEVAFIWTAAGLEGFVAGWVLARMHGGRRATVLCFAVLLNGAAVALSFPVHDSEGLIAPGGALLSLPVYLIGGLILNCAVWIGSRTRNTSKSPRIGLVSL
jgi:hypothetical protein